MATNGHKLATEFPVFSKFSCDICKKNYKYRKGLWSHNKKYHSQQEIVVVEPKPALGNVSEELYLDVLKQNSELVAKQGELIAKHALLEDKLIELAKKNYKK